MKKQKYNTKKSITPMIPKKKGITMRDVVIVALCCGLFASTMYSVNCFITKVCKPVIFEKFVRDDITILMPKGALTAELANTQASRELGLSGRHMMKDTDGMLFAFDVPGRYGFWMKDMEFPLDIIWIDENGVVVSIERGLTPESYTNNKQVFMNQADASYVLEVNAGQAEKFGLYLGSKVKMVE
jgi:uncharacterized membrane protein (UPF0127 family)